MKKIKINFSLEINDWMAFQKYCLQNSKRFKSLKRVPMIISGFVIFVLVLNIIIAASQDSSLNFSDKIPSFFIIGMFLFFALFYSRRYESVTLNTVRKILEKGNNFALFQGTVFEFSEKEISSKSKNSDTVYQWAAIKKYIETEEYFFLYTSASSAIILPKSKLGLNQTEISALKQLFSQKIHPSTNY